MRSVYFDNGARRRDLSYDEAVNLARLGTGLLWLDLDTHHDSELKRLAADFGVHPTAVDDWASSTHHRPRIKDFDSYVVLLMSAVNIAHGEADIVDVLLFAGKNYMITVHKREVGALGSLFDAACATGNALSKGPGHLLFYIADSLIDTFFPAFDVIDGQVAGIENRILSDPREKVLNQLFRIRRHCLSLRKSLGPMRDVFGALSRLDVPLVEPEMRPYFMGIYDHILRLIDTVDTYRDILSSALEVYLSAQSNRMNEVMKTLTIIATIMMPLTVITGIYGMNFNIPEFRMKYGYHGVLGVMAAITLGMLAWFRKRKWI